MRDGTGLSALVTIGVAGIVKDVSRLVTPNTADRAYMPVLFRAHGPIGLIFVRNGANIATDVTIGIADVVKDVLCPIQLLLQASFAGMPMMGGVSSPGIGGNVDNMSRGRLQLISADRTELCLLLGGLLSGNMLLLVLLVSADLACVPMSAFITEPDRGVAMVDHAGISAERAGRITGIIKVVRLFILLGVADGAFVPMLVIAVGGDQRIAVRDLAGRSADIAGRVTGIVIEMVGRVLPDLAG